MGIPYVYLVKNKTTGYKYIGVKYSGKSDPDTFWKNYFTSSIHVKKLINIYGKEDFIYRILKIFETSHDALKYERELLKKVIFRDDYLNLHINFIGDLTEEEFLSQRERQRKAASIVGTLCKNTKTGYFKFNKEERKEICSKAGKRAAVINKELNRAIFNKDFRERQHKTLKEKQVSAYYDPKLRKEICSKGGKKGCFTKFYAEKNNISEEERIEAQRDRGRRGGPKNKGFKWYNDGIKSFKYTSKMQNNKDFYTFLKENENFKPGRAMKSPYKRKK